MSIKGMWTRAKDLFTGAKGRVRALFRELPPASAIVAETQAWAETAVELGDVFARLEPEDSKLLAVVRNGAQLLEFVAPISGLGSDKERALLAKVREATRLIGWADAVSDAWWERVGRPVLVKYAERCKALNAWMTP